MDPRPSSRRFIIGKVISAVIVDAIDIVFAAVVDGLTFPADRLTVASRLVHILDVGQQRAVVVVAVVVAVVAAVDFQLVGVGVVVVAAAAVAVDVAVDVAVVVAVVDLHYRE